LLPEGTPILLRSKPCSGRTRSARGAPEKALQSGPGGLKTGGRAINASVVGEEKAVERRPGRVGPVWIARSRLAVEVRGNPRSAVGTHRFICSQGQADGV